MNYRPLHNRSSSRRLLKNPLSPGLLKKVQMQGGVTHPSDGYPARCEAYLVRTSQRRASAPTPQMGLFQQPAGRPKNPGVGFPSHSRGFSRPGGAVLGKAASTALRALPFACALRRAVGRPVRQEEPRWVPRNEPCRFPEGVPYALDARTAYVNHHPWLAASPPLWQGLT